MKHVHLKNFLRAAALVACVSLTGCVVVPVPYGGWYPDHGWHHRR